MDFFAMSDTRSHTNGMDRGRPRGSANGDGVGGVSTWRSFTSSHERTTPAMKARRYDRSDATVDAGPRACEAAYALRSTGLRLRDPLTACFTTTSARVPSIGICHRVLRAVRAGRHHRLWLAVRTRGSLDLNSPALRSCSTSWLATGPAVHCRGEIDASLDARLLRLRSPRQPPTAGPMRRISPRQIGPHGPCPQATGRHELKRGELSRGLPRVRTASTVDDAPCRTARSTRGKCALRCTLALVVGETRGQWIAATVARSRRERYARFGRL